MIPKSKNNMKQKPISFLAPGQLAKERSYGKKTLNVSFGSKRINAVEQQTNNFCNHERTGGNGVHNLFVHYGEDKWEERNITEECSFLDILSICNKFIDIYTVGIKITDENGTPLRNDKDLLGLLKEQENVEDISIYLSVDATVQPLLFKLPEHNPSFVSSPCTSEVRVVITKDGSHGEKMYENTGKSVETEKVRKVRGMNKNLKIVSLKSGEKHVIQFYNNRGVGPNHTYWSRHLGKIVRDKQVCPIRVRTWKDVTESEKQHMWAMVKECFSNPNMESYREHTLEHMGSLWSAWRSSLNAKYVKPCKTKVLALKNVPSGMNAKDWEWLVTEKFLSDKFQKISSQNSDNRVKGVMHHRTGSQPHRQIIYEMGGKEDTPPDIAKIFYATRQRNGKLVEPREQEKYDEIIKTVQANASLSPIDVVETCFGPQNHSNVFGFGGGMKRKHFDDPQAAQIKELKVKLHEKEEENNDLRRRVEGIESILIQMGKENQPTSHEPPRSHDPE